MLAEERFGQILNLLSKQRTATVQELCEALGTSESTIRRDLTELDRLGKLNKVHGGATLPDSRFQAEEPTMQVSGYPDCRDAFIKSLNVTLNLAMDEQFVLQSMCGLFLPLTVICQKRWRAGNSAKISITASTLSA